MYQKLKKLADQTDHQPLSSLCAKGEQFEHRTVHFNDALILDSSRQRMASTTFTKAIELANLSGANAYFKNTREGAISNPTEHRAVLHTLLRNPMASQAEATLVSNAIEKMRTLSDAIKTGRWRGQTGKVIKHVVNIGIGGSDLGPRMVYRALEQVKEQHIDVHWVANIDPAHITQKLAHLDPEETLIFVASKSFKTPETLNNARAAHRWLIAGGITEFHKHLMAATTNLPMAAELGIPEDNILPLWDWVGGRFSVWSTIGLPLMIGLQDGAFEAFLKGAKEMDDHTESETAESNIPMQLALFELWNQIAFDTQSRAVLPYCHDLRLLPAHLQQLEMESLGKSVHLDGTAVEHHTGGIVWGTEGSNGQHSYHQLLHQGSRQFAAEIIMLLKSQYDRAQHNKLLANALAQSQVFTYGQSQQEALKALTEQGLDTKKAEFIAKHKEIKGNRAHSLIMLQELTPYSLGALVAAYENKVAFMGYWLDINAFDQWGVELGKVHAATFEHLIDTTENGDIDQGYQNIIGTIKSTAQ